MIRITLISFMVNAALVCGFGLQRTKLLVHSELLESDLPYHIPEKHLTDLFAAILDLTETEAKIVLAHVKDVTSHLIDSAKGSCNGSECRVDINVPILKELILSLKYVKKRDVMVFSISRVDKELFRIEICAAETPKICVMTHFCGQIKHIYLVDGELCGSVIFNGLPVLRDRCLPL